MGSSLHLPSKHGCFKGMKKKKKKLWNLWRIATMKVSVIRQTNIPDNNLRMKCQDFHYHYYSFLIIISLLAYSKQIAI